MSAYTAPNEAWMLAGRAAAEPTQSNNNNNIISTRYSALQRRLLLLPLAVLSSWQRNSFT